MSTSTKTIAIGLFLSMLLAAGVIVSGCDNSSSAVKETPVVPMPVGTAPPGVDGGGGPVDDGGTGADGAPSDCVQDPHTHAEIINACTDAVKITKNPMLPLLLADGGLPLLP